MTMRTGSADQVVSITLMLNARETYVLRVIGNGAGWIELVI